MVSSLLTKDYRKRPAIVDILQKHVMKQKMQQLGYGADDHLLTQTMVNGGGLQFKRSSSEVVKSDNKLPSGHQDKKDFPQNKFVNNNKAPNVEQLRKELANKNR